MLEQMDIQQNPYIGILALTNDRMTLLASLAEDAEVEVFEKALGTDVYRCTFGGLSLLGSLGAINSKALIIPNFVDVDELGLPDDIEIITDVGTKFNAYGNNILANDRFALVHPDYNKRTLKKIGDVLGVEAERGTIGGFKTLGSVAVATNKGLLTHPMTSQDELVYLSEVFGVPCEIGTANYGVGQVGACLIANSAGAVVGNRSTGIELGRVEDALMLY